MSAATEAEVLRRLRCEQGPIDAVTLALRMDVSPGYIRQTLRWAIVRARRSSLRNRSIVRSSEAISGLRSLRATTSRILPS